MALQFSSTVNAATLDAVETTVGTAPTLEIRTGTPPTNCSAAATGTLLLSITLPSDWMAAAVDGIKERSGVWSGIVATGGEAGYFRIIKSGSCHIQGVVGLSGVADLGLSDATLAAGQTVTVTTFRLTAGLVPADTAPEQFSFTSVSGATTSTLYTSNEIVPTGFNQVVAITITGGEYSANGFTWTSAAGNFAPGHSVRVRLTSSASAGTAVTATLTIGGVSSNYTVTTTAAATGAVRYIRPTAAGLANGTSWANAAALSALNSMIVAVGAGGTVYIRADEGDYTVGSVLTLSAGGNAGSPVTIRGVNVSLAPMKAVLKTARTSPWPTGAVGANLGSDLFRLNAGANHLSFQSMHWRDCKFAMRAADQHFGITFGNPAYRDPSVANLIPADVFFDRDSAGYQTLVSDIFTASAAGVSADIQTFAIDMTNCYRGVDTGDPSAAATSDTFFDFAVYGGVYRGSARGWYRLRGAGRNIWFQDMDMDGGGKAYVSEDGSFCVGIELNGPDTAVAGTGVSNVVFLRCIANNHRATTLGTYSNGDGFSGERENQNTCYIRCTANGNEDGGVETKARNVTVIGLNVSGNRRNMRLWGDSDTFHLNSTDPSMTERVGGGRAHIYTESSTGWQRIFSGSMTNVVEAAPAMASGGVRGFIAIHTGVTLNLNGSATGAVDNATVKRVVTDLFSTTPLSITSSGTRTQASGTSVPFTPTSNVAAFFDKTGGPDQALIAGPHTFSLPAQTTSNPQDADGNNTYIFTIEGVSASRRKATQTVTITVT